MRKMLLLGLCCLLAMAMPAMVPVGNAITIDPCTQTKVDICHELGNGSYTKPSESEQAIIDETGHGGHSGDIIPPFTCQKQDGIWANYPGQNWPNSVNPSQGCVGCAAQPTKETKTEDVTETEQRPCTGGSSGYQLWERINKVQSERTCNTCTPPSCGEWKVTGTVYGTWNKVSDTCTSPCTGPWTENVEVGCPVGQTGQHWMLRTHQCDGTYKDTELDPVSNTCTEIPQPCNNDAIRGREEFCPVGYTGKIIILEQQQCPDGNWVEIQRINQCTEVCGERKETRTSPCKKGENGEITEERYLKCPCQCWTDWKVVNDTCQSCLGQYVDRKSYPCEAGQQGEIIKERTCSGCKTPPTCGEWSIVSNTCNTPPAPPQCPDYYVDRVVKCPEGQIGYIIQHKMCNACEFNPDGNPKCTEWFDYQNKCQSPSVTTIPCKIDFRHLCAYESPDRLSSIIEWPREINGVDGCLAKEGYYATCVEIPCTCN